MHPHDSLLRSVHLSYRYPVSGGSHPTEALREWAVRDLSLAFRPGEQVALLGANGSGKSTLLELLQGALPPSEGEVLFQEQPVHYPASGAPQHWRELALVQQDPWDQLFGTTVAQDVAFGPLNLGLAPQEVNRRVEEALTALGLLPLAHLPPHLLSHGQRRRVTIAGALALHPRVLLLDEPTAGLDAAAADELETELSRLAVAGLLVVVATHDHTFACRWASRIVLLAAGKLLREGPAAELLAQPALLRETGVLRG